MVALHSSMVRTAPATFALHGGLDALAHLSDWVQTVANQFELSDRCAFRLDLVLAEAVTNIVQHAGAGNGVNDGALSVLVEVQRVDERILVRIEDTGGPFDPTAAPVHVQPHSLEDARIGGLGIHLIRAYTERLDYQRVAQRNQLRMTIACNG